MNLYGILPLELARRVAKQRIDEKRPTCHHCGLRQRVHALVNRGGKLIKPSHRNHLFGWRRFLEHHDGNGRWCIGSGEPLVYARGFDQ